MPIAALMDKYFLKTVSTRGLNFAQRDFEKKLLVPNDRLPLVKRTMKPIRFRCIEITWIDPKEFLAVGNRYQSSRPSNS